MTLRITNVKLEPDILVLRLSGPITHESKLNALDSAFHNLVHHGEINFIFDLAGAEEIDTAGILLLIRCFFAAVHAGGQVRFAAARPDLVGPFERAGFDTLVLFDPTVAAACEHLKRGTETGR